MLQSRLTHSLVAKFPHRSVVACSRRTSKNHKTVKIGGCALAQDNTVEENPCRAVFILLKPDEVLSQLEIENFDVSG